MSGLAGLRIDADALAALSPVERDAVSAELAQLDKALRDNPLIGYRPHEKQVVFHEPPWPALRAFFGGNRSGKTTAAMTDTIIQCVDADAVPAHLKAFKRWDPPFKCRIITPDFGDTHEVVLEKIREWCPKPQLKGGSFDRAYDKQRKVLWFKNESRIHFNSNVQEREQLGGSDLQRVLYDEEPRREHRVESLTRLIDHDGEEIFAMTPLEGMSWIYDEIYEPWEKADEEGARDVERDLGVRVVVVDMDDNPHLSESGKQRALAAYTGEEREARKSGRFVSFAGLIYPQFSTSRHVIPQIPGVPFGVETFCAIDPGIRHMCAVLWCYLDADDVFVVFDELPAKGKTIAQVCREIQTRNLKWGTRVEGRDQVVPLTPRWYVIDPSARNKNNQTGRSDQQEFADNNIFTIPGQNAVGAGINRVRQRLEADRLKVCANCEELRSEFKKYRWQKDSSRSENDPREAPVKTQDHELDALRYAVAARPLAPSRENAKPTDTMKDRLLRDSLKRLRARGRGGQAPLDHFAGPGVFS